MRVSKDKAKTFCTMLYRTGWTNPSEYKGLTDVLKVPKGTGYFLVDKHRVCVVHYLCQLGLPFQHDDVFVEGNQGFLPAAIKRPGDNAAPSPSLMWD